MYGDSLWKSIIFSPLEGAIIGIKQDENGTYGIWVADLH